MSAIREILLVGSTHHDVGYTNSPRIVDDQHRRIVGEVVRLCGADPGFRWTFEVARPVLKALARDGDRLRHLARAGRVCVTGGYLNMTQLPSDVEFGAMYDAVADLRAAGLPVRTQMHGDVNGIAWGVVDDMLRSGLTRLVMALNPDHGRAPFEQPSGFWWEGPSGGRVFVWLSTHYGVGEQWGVIDGDVAAAERHIADFVAGLEARDDYPYDVAVVHAANDNRWPTPLFLRVAEHWNAAGGRPPMRAATIDEALDLLVPAAADAPVVRGEWSDWWSHGHGSTAREVAVYREARSFARAAQTSLGLALLRGAAGTPTGAPALAHVLGYRRGPVVLRDQDEILADLARVDESLLLFGEHTFGSWETYSKPHSTFSHSHWNAKAAFAYEAYDLARDLAVEGMFRLAAGGDPHDGVLVVNTTGRDREEPVEVEIDKTRRARLVARTPAFGVSLHPAPAQGQTVEGRDIRLGNYRVTVDPARGGVVALVDIRTGTDLVDHTVPYGLGTVVAERIPDGCDHPMVTRSPKDFHPDHPGPVFDRLTARGDAEPRITGGDDHTTITWHTAIPGVTAATLSLTLYRDCDLIDLDAHLVKPQRWEPESIFVAFPFAVADPRFLLETAGGVYEAGAEQLPDTSRDWYSVQHAVGVGTVLWGTFDAPLVQVGGFHTGRWARTLEPTGGHINSWLMNNLHFTNFQAAQDGTRRYRYRFTALPREATREQVRVFGRDLLEPLQARHWAGPARSGPAGLRVEPAEAVFAEVRPVGPGTVRVRLRNIGGDHVSAAVHWNGTHEVTLTPFGVADVILEAGTPPRAR